MEPRSTDQGSGSAEPSLSSAPVQDLPPVVKARWGIRRTHESLKPCLTMAERISDSHLEENRFKGQEWRRTYATHVAVGSEPTLASSLDNQSNAYIENINGVDMFCIPRQASVKFAMRPYDKTVDSISESASADWLPVVGENNFRFDSVPAIVRTYEDRNTILEDEILNNIHDPSMPLRLECGSRTLGIHNAERLPDEPGHSFAAFTNARMANFAQYYTEAPPLFRAGSIVSDQTPYTHIQRDKKIYCVSRGVANLATLIQPSAGPHAHRLFNLILEQSDNLMIQWYNHCVYKQWDKAAVSLAFDVMTVPLATLKINYTDYHNFVLWQRTDMLPRLPWFLKSSIAYWPLWPHSGTWSGPRPKLIS